MITVAVHAKTNAWGSGPHMLDIWEGIVVVGSTMATSTKKDPNPKPQTLHLKGTKPYIHNLKMHKLNPKKN